MTKEAIIRMIQGLAEKLGHAPSQTELMKMTEVNRRQIRRHFGAYKGALRESGLERRGGGYRVDADALFLDWAGIVRQTGKLPSLAEYEYLSEYSHSPLTTRYGGWTQVPAGMKQFAESQGLAEEWRDVLEIVAREQQAQEQRATMTGTGTGSTTGTGTGRRRAPVLMNQPIFGPPMRPYPLANGPMNEDGVIFLFGALAEELGYVANRIQGEFPDCEALRQIDDERWQRVRIEFEYESRNFLMHQHDPGGCDVIVCWAHNWPECPLEVLELRAEVAQKRE